MHLTQIAERPKVSMIPTTISQDEHRWQCTLFEATNGDTYFKKSKQVNGKYVAQWFRVTGLETEKSGDPKSD